MRPLIGIGQCLDDRGRIRAGRETSYLDTGYARAVEAAGGIPLHLPLQSDPRALVARLDGLLLPGGGDFAPDRDYGGAPFDPVAAALLAFDRALLACARERDLPQLGICYGMQLLALEGGGSLHFHLPDDLPEAGPHELPEPDGRHQLRVEAGSRLAEILGREAESVNSRHHQGVSQPGPGWRVCAHAEDGVIEAIEHAGASFQLGVQWHPERLPGPHGDRLFGAFVAACAQRATRERP